MKDNTLKTIKYYWQATLKYKWVSLVMFISFIVAFLMQVITPLFYKDFFDVLTSGQPKDLVVNSLISILILIFVLAFLEWLFWRISSFLLTFLESRVMADLANKCFAYLHRHSFTFFENNFVGSLVKRVGWFTKAYEAVIDRLVYDLLPLITTILFIMVVLFLRNIWLGFGVLVWIIIFMIINVFFSKYKLKYDIERSEIETEATGLLADTVTNNSNVKLFNGYQREKKNYAKVNEKLRKIRRFTWDLGQIFESFQGFLMIGLEIGIFYLAIRLWEQGILTVGDFVLIQAYLITIFMRLWHFGRTIVRLYESFADAEEMTIILNTPHEIQDVHNAKELIIKESKIEFKEVHFAYHKTRKILKDFNLTIKPGEKIALIGPSGAGKSTIAKLLLRMHDIEQGKILIDSQKVSQVTQESLWSQLSFVPQDPILFHRPLKENIAYGNPRSTMKDIIKASQAAHCHEFIENFPEGYETYVGERGVKLSGGERQRVAIARAILKNSPILILDEATSSLDSHAEGLIQEALNELMKDKTVIAIAHRLSTIKKMDRILVIDQGKIMEEGTHAELTKKKDGIYNKLWELQAGGFIQ